MCESPQRHGWAVENLIFSSPLDQRKRTRNCGKSSRTGLSFGFWWCLSKPPQRAARMPPLPGGERSRAPRQTITFGASKRELFTLTDGLKTLQRKLRGQWKLGRCGPGPVACAAWRSLTISCLVVVSKGIYQWTHLRHLAYMYALDHERNLRLKRLVYTILFTMSSSSRSIILAGLIFSTQRYQLVWGHARVP